MLSKQPLSKTKYSYFCIMVKNFISNVRLKEKVFGYVGVKLNTELDKIAHDKRFKNKEKHTFIFLMLDDLDYDATVLSKTFR